MYIFCRERPPRHSATGISLIALILTIIVIIILAAIILGVSTGTPEKAQLASFMTDLTEIQQGVETRKAMNSMPGIDGTYDVNDGFTKVRIKRTPYSTDEDGWVVNLENANIKSSTRGNDYEDVVENSEVVFGEGAPDIYVYDTDGVVYYAKGYREGEKTYYTKQDTTETSIQPVEQEDQSLVKGVNPPLLGAGMTEVYWDASFNEIERGDANFDINNWYDYIVQTIDTEDGGTSKWANAKLDGSYFVWIPRYAYKITYFTTAAKTTVSATKTNYGDVDVLFMHGTSSTKYIDKATNCEQNLPSGYAVHPAFISNMELGGWDSELTGIWVGKYEASRSDATSSENGTSNSLKVVPGVRCYRNITIGTKYTISREYKPELNSHMMKNSEWGVVTYLAYSKYGRNGTDVTVNNNSDYLTGYGGETVNTTSSTPTYAYNTNQGVLASTTGNIYGIYDMSGGVYENVSAYYSGGTSSYLANGASFVYIDGTTTINTQSTKYATAYSGTSAQQYHKQGDATYETGSWNGDFAYFINSSDPFFIRGGERANGVYAGLSCFVENNGIGSVDVTFRICLAP